MKASLKTYLRICIPLLMGVTALSVPLLRNFHIESALLVSVVGCFWAGWKAQTPMARKQTDARSALSVLGYLYLFGAPLLVYSVAMGCFNVHGLGFWLLYPVPSVFLGYAIGRLCRIWRAPYGQVVTFCVLAGVALGVFLVEVLSFPQVYFFNHVWGGWPGPIYDETVELSGSLLYFRCLTACWVLLLWTVASYGSDRIARWIFWLAALALALGYTRLDEWGVVTPEPYLQSRLGGSYETRHFQIFYDARHFTSDEIRLLALEHEFHLAEIVRELALVMPDSAHKIHSYLYAHPWQKKKLVGAKFTSYVPVWLEQDQLHIAKGQISSSLRHELVHVMAKEFGNSLFNASWSIGLIEGLAVALAPDESSVSTIDQIVASDGPYPQAGDMKRALLPMGFYGGRSSVSYTTSGSFVGYLLREYPIDSFKQAYRTGDVETAYGLSFFDLVQGWHRYLEAVPVDSADRQVARRLFSIPSLFEQACPRTPTPFAQSWDDYEYSMAERDTAQALVHLDKALALGSGNAAIKTVWAFQNLEAGRPEKVQLMAASTDSSAELLLLYADAFALTGEARLAEQYLHEAAVRLSRDSNRRLEIALATRLHPEQWDRYLQLTYQDYLFDPQVFSSLYYRTKIRAVDYAIHSGKTKLVTQYARQLLAQPADTLYFNRYVAMLHRLAHYGETELANAWLKKVEALPLRERQKERLALEARWIRFVSNRGQRPASE